MITLARRGLIEILMISAFAVGAAYAQGQQLTFRSIDGQTINLANERGKVVVLAFSATWAPLASKELPALQKLAEQYPGRQVVFYWVSINAAKPGARNYASDADLQAFAARHGLRMPVLRDPEQSAYRALGLTVLPSLILLDRTGKIAHKHAGFDSSRADAFGDVMQAIDQLLR